jgi:hypothetical protein
LLEAVLVEQDWQVHMEAGAAEQEDYSLAALLRLLELHILL